MISPISTTASAQAAAPVPPSKGSSTKASGQKSEARKDSVHLSSAAQSQLSAAQSALQEASETPAQTAKEALGGDLQAKRLEAREAQSSEAVTYSPRTVRSR